MATAVNLLKQRFPYQFERLRAHCEYFPGWMPTLTRACEQIDALLDPDKRGFHWTQIKEKFGTARFYYRFQGLECAPPSTEAAIAGNDLEAPIPVALKGALEEEVRRVVSEAEKATTMMCMVCGGMASVKLYGGWFANLCELHPQYKEKAFFWS